MVIYEPGKDERHTMGGLDGHTVATFDIDRDSFHSNQTVCMGYPKTSEQGKPQKWTYELC